MSTCSYPASRRSSFASRRPSRMPTTATLIAVATAARNTMSRIIGLPPPGAERFEREEFGLQRDSEVRQAVGELRSDAGRLQTAEEAAVVVDAHAVVEEVEILHHDDVALHAEHLGHLRDATSTVAKSREVYDEIECSRLLLTNRSNGEVDASHEHHRLDTREGVAAGCSSEWWSASRHGPCSSPATCRGPRDREPRRQ